MYYCIFLSFFFIRVTLFFIPKNLQRILRDKFKKESWQLVKKQKSYSMSKNVIKMPKNSKILV